MAGLLLISKSKISKNGLYLEHAFEIWPIVFLFKSVSKALQLDFCIHCKQNMYNQFTSFTKNQDLKD